MRKNNSDKLELAEDIEDITSMQECTGLISTGVNNEDEYDNLMNLQKFSPKNIKDKKS